MSRPAPEVDYKQESEMAPIYRYSKVFPIQGTNDLDISSQGQESTFEISPSVFNLSKSYLSWDIQVPALALNVANLWSDCLASIFQLQIVTRSGVYLMDINRVANYTKAVCKLNTSYDEYKALGFGALGATATTALPFTGVLNRRNDTNVTIAGTGVAAAVSYRNQNADGTATSLQHDSVDGPLEFVSRNTLNALAYYKIKLPLSLLKHTICQIDKDIYSPEILNLRIVWNDRASVGWFADSITDPSTTPLALSGSVVIKNATLYIANEANRVLQQKVMEQVMTRGLTLDVDYVYTYLFTQAASSDMSFTYRFNRAHGRSLKRIYNMPFDDAVSLNTRYFAGNIAGAVCSSFYSMLDNERLQQFNVDCTKQEDWLVIEPFARASAMTSLNVYEKSWTTLDSFEGSQYSDADGTVKRGISLEQEKLYQFFATTAANALNWHTTVVCQKVCTISPAGITCQ